MVEKNKELKNWLFWVVVSVVIFAGLSLWIGMRQSVWFDEAYSINLAKRSFGEMIDLTAVDVHPPVYYILLKIWGGIFGFDELSLRLSSVLAMSFAIFLAAILVKKIRGKKAAMLAVAFLSLSPMLIRYGFEIRMYALATLIVVAASLALWKILHTEKICQKRCLQALYALLVTVGMMTLYYTIVVWLTHLIYLIYRAIKDKKSIIKQDFWLVYGLSILLFLPWLPVTLRQLGNGALAPISERLDFSNMMGIMSFNFIYRPVWQTDQIFGALMLGFIVLLGILIVKRKKIGKIENDGFSFVAFLAIGPIVLEFILCLVTPMYVERYLVYTAPFLMITIAILCFDIGKRLPVVYIATLLILGVANLWWVGNYNFQRLQKPDIKEAAADLKEDRELPVLANSPYEAIELGYYLDKESYFYAPYERLSGGYAVLDGSKMQIRGKEDLENFANCVKYVFYDEGEIEKMLKEEGFIERSEDDLSNERAMKYKIFCRN